MEKPVDRKSEKKRLKQERREKSIQGKTATGAPSAQQPIKNEKENVSQKTNQQQTAAKTEKNIAKTTKNEPVTKEKVPKVTKSSSEGKKVPESKNQPTAVVGSTKEKKSGSSKKEENQKEDIFQAVLIADNFGNSIFGPQCPLLQEGLISLANRKLIDYSLESLTVSGVQEIFIYCSTDADGLREHIKNSKWCEMPNCSVSVIVSETSLSLGDALRDLDSKGVIKNDFLLLSPGVVTSLPLRPLLTLHNENCKKDKGAVLTLVHKKMEVGHRARPKNHTSSIVINSKTNKVIAYENKPSGKKLSIPLEGLQEEMDIYLDSVDTGIAVCSPTLLLLFTDNFDFSSLPDFIRGILINEEILGNSVYLSSLSSSYAGRVTDFGTYSGIAADILQRWTYPIVPDMPFGLSPDQSLYTFHKNFVYKGTDVYGADTGKSVLIGSGTSLESGVEISRCILGDNCKIQSDVIITDSHVGSNIEIPQGCQIIRSILSDGTKLEKGDKIIDKLIFDNKIYPIEAPVEGSGDKSDSEFEEEEKDDVESEDENSSDESEVYDGVSDDYITFCTEVMESLLRGFRQKLATENLIVEINSSKFAYNMSSKEVTAGIVQGILNLPPKLYSDSYSSFSPKLQWEKLKEVFIGFKKLLANYVKTKDGEMDLIEALEEYADEYKSFRTMLMQTLHHLYDEDILSEESILKWHRSESEWESGSELRNLVTKLIQWLEASDDSSN